MDDFERCLSPQKCVRNQQDSPAELNVEILEKAVFWPSSFSTIFSVFFPLSAAGITRLKWQERCEGIEPGMKHHFDNEDFFY
jgi:hypothetical protein